MSKSIHSVTEFSSSARGITPACQSGDRAVKNQREFDRCEWNVSAQMRQKPHSTATVTQFAAPVPNPAGSASAPPKAASNKVSLIRQKAEGDNR